MNDAKEIFFGALEHASPEELASYLDNACAGDLTLRTRVEELLLRVAKLAVSLAATGRLLRKSSHYCWKAPAR